jgi:ornithine cyclodeaminase
MLHLGVDELSSALEGIQPLDVLAEDLAVRPTHTAHNGSGRLSPWPDEGGADPELVLLTDYRAGIACVLPVAGLRGCRAAMLTRVATQELLNRDATRAVVLGCGAAADLQLAMIARHLPSIRHITVCPAAGEHGCPIEQRALDEIDLAGVRLTVTEARDAAVAAADLVVLACAAATWPAGVRPKTGTLVVNATEQDLPDELLDAAGLLFVDDTELVGPDRFPRHTVDADLSQVLAGEHEGRTRHDDVVVVALLSANLLDVVLARRLYQAAVNRGLGNQRLE